MGSHPWRASSAAPRWCRDRRRTQCRHVHPQAGTEECWPLKDDTELGFACKIPSMKKALTALLVLSAVAVAQPSQAQTPAPPMRLAIAGLVHGHVSGFLRAALARRDVEIVGVFEPDAALLKKYAATFKLPDGVLFGDLAAMLDRAKPEAVASFTNTLDHPVVVEAAAARRIHVMMEKPLAVSNAHAQRIRRAAETGKIQVF